jgi:hypothetical protein
MRIYSWRGEPVEQSRAVHVIVRKRRHENPDLHCLARVLCGKFKSYYFCHTSAVLTTKYFFDTFYHIMIMESLLDLHFTAKYLNRTNTIGLFTMDGALKVLHRMLHAENCIIFRKPYCSSPH